MKFINKTGKTKKVRINCETNNSGYDWLNVKDGSEIEIPKEYGVKLSFDQVVVVKVEPVEPKEEPKEIKEVPKVEPKVEPVELKKKIKSFKRRSKK